LGLGEFLAFSSAGAWAFAVIAFKRSGETWSPLALNLFKNLVSIALLSATILIFKGLQLPDLTLQEWILLSISGLIGLAIADTLYFAALQQLGASRTGIASTMYSPCVVILSFFLLGERLSTIQILGFALVLFGVILISYKADMREISPRALKLGLSYAVFAVFLMALGIVMIKDILENKDFLWSVQIRVIAGTIGIVVVQALRGKTITMIKEFRKPHRWMYAIIGSVIGSYLAMMLWLGGYKYTSASVASILNETSSLFIVILAWLFLGESLNRTKIIAVGFTFTGVLLMLT